MRATSLPPCPKCMIIIHLSHRGTSPRTDRKGPTMIAYRMQDESRDLAGLLDVEQQYSFPMSNDDEKVRHGVSGCETLADLAAYIACHAIEADMPVIVVIEGPESEDAALDADDGEVLLLPTRAEVIADDAAFFDLVSDLVDLHWERGLDCAALREIAAERI